MTKETIRFELRIVTTRVDTPKTVRVKAHTRVVNGRKVKVRSHIRKY